MRHRSVAACLTTAVTVTVAIAAQPAGASDTPASLAGTCQFGGTEQFSPPLTLSARPARAVVDAPGRCSGTLVTADGTRHRLDGAAARYRQDATATSGSCVGTALRGTGTITVGGTTLPFTLAEPQVAAVAAMQLSAAGWRASGVAYLTPTPQLPATALSCLSSGVGQIPVTVSLVASRR